MEPVRSPARWIAAPIPESAAALEEAGHPAWLAALLARRGVDSAAAAAAFLAPGVERLTPAAELPGVTAAAERLDRAAAGGEKVAVVGDYDVDGISATALLTAVFEAAGLTVTPILPRRLEEGYGFQPVHVERALAAGCRLVVTADCGSTSHPALEAAGRRGVEVIVTDHHLTAEPLPPGVLEINPRRAGGEAAPGSELSGAGLALKLALEVARMRGRDIEPAALLRIACLGTICDMVPLLGENRIIAAVGLEALAETRSVGLQALFERAGTRPPFDTGDIGFKIGPRLNAAGRLATADPALELLLTRDPGRARALAERLDVWNRERQAIEARVVEEARARLAERHPTPRLLVAWDEGWHPGVLGIAAGRIAREANRPTLLMAVDGPLAAGSGRSVPGIHLHAFLTPWQERLERFGGHAQAVGLAAEHRRLPELVREWEEAAATWDDDLLVRRFEYELEPAPGEVGEDLLAAIARLEPFGIGNRRPLLRLGPLRVEGTPRRFGNGHLAARAAAPDGTGIELLGWGWQRREGDLEGPFEVLGHLQHDRYRGGVVVRLADARPWRAEGAESAAGSEPSRAGAHPST